MSQFFTYGGQSSGLFRESQSQKKGFPGDPWVKKEPACQCRTHRGTVGKIPGRRTWWHTPVSLPGESRWQRQPQGLQSMGSQRVGHGWSDLAHTHKVKRKDRNKESEWMWGFRNLQLEWTLKAVQPLVEGWRDSGADQRKSYNHKRRWHTTGLIRLHPDMAPQEEKLSQSQISQYKTKWHRGHLQKGRRERNLLVEKKVKEEACMSCWHFSAAWWGICGWGAIAAYGLRPTRLSYQ